MARNSELTQQRNQYIVTRFRQIRRKNPHWKIDFIIKEVAQEVFLSSVTVVNIIKASCDDKVPTGATISKICKQQQATL
jgi:Uri superfamily endonuclease